MCLSASSFYTDWGRDIPWLGHPPGEGMLVNKISRLYINQYHKAPYDKKWSLYCRGFSKNMCHEFESLWDFIFFYLQFF